MAIGELEKIDENIYCLEHSQYMPGGVYFPTRMTIVRLKNGRLWLHSPVPVEDSMAEKIATIGPVAHIVAPNHFHNLYVLSAIERWPEAQLWISPGLEKKCPEFAPHATAIDPIIKDDAKVPTRESEPEWREELDWNLIQGAPKMNELVFFHRATGTLILADLVFNWGRPRGLRQTLLFTVMDVSNGLRQSRAWNLVTNDRKAAAASCEPVFAWPIRRLIPCHGDIREDATSAALRDAVIRF